MSQLLVHKIDRANWEEHIIHQETDTPGDAITHCIKTKGNTLSLWQIESIDKLEEAALAIIGCHDRPEPFDVVAINYTDIADKGLTSISNEGTTRVSDLNNTHLDIIDITYQKLGTLASLIYDSLRQDMVRRYEIERQGEVLHEAIQAGRLTRATLSKPFKKLVDSVSHRNHPT